MADGFDGFADAEVFFGDETAPDPKTPEKKADAEPPKKDSPAAVKEKAPAPGKETEKPPKTPTAAVKTSPKDDGAAVPDEMTEEDMESARNLAAEKVSLIGEAARAASAILMRWGKSNEIKSYRNLMRCIGLLDVAIGSLGGKFDSVPKSLVTASKRTIQGAVERLGHMSPYDKDSIWEDSTLIIAALCDVFIAASVGDAPNEIAEYWDDELRGRIMSTSTTKNDLSEVINLVGVLGEE